MKLSPQGKKNLPKAPPLTRLLGPSFILLGLGLGSGELILWPFLATTWGLGILWGAVLGITFQFFLNMEIERYTLATGESVFVGLARKLKIVSPIWFIFSTIIPWMWPGIIASSATLFTSILGLKYTSLAPILLLLLIGTTLTLGPIIYKTQEALQKTLLLLGVPFVFVLALFLSNSQSISELPLGLLGRGKDYWFLPKGISLASFLGAFAYAGAGGNLNLVQSFYIREKGYGMGKFSGRITSILTGKSEKITLEGNTFPITPKNLKRFSVWWKRVNIEHFVVFWSTGALTMILLSLLARSTVTSPETGINFLFTQASFISQKTFPVVGSLFLLVAALMLFSTQFSVLDATSRIMSENLCISSPKFFKIPRLPFFYYIFLWTQIIAGVIIFSLGFTEPLQLIITGAVLNAFTMFVYSGLVIFLNKSTLPKEIKPSILRTIMVFAAFLFYGIFSLFVIHEKFF
jgi:hypothetical protein